MHSFEHIYSPEIVRIQLLSPPHCVSITLFAFWLPRCRFSMFGYQLGWTCEARVWVVVVVTRSPNFLDWWILMVVALSTQAFLLKHPITKIKRLKCLSPFVYKKNHDSSLRVISRCCAIFLLFLPPFLLHFLPSWVMLLRCCFFFLASSSFVFFICVLLQSKYCHYYCLWLFCLNDCWLNDGIRVQWHFFCEKNSYGSTIRKTHTYQQ